MAKGKLENANLPISTLSLIIERVHGVKFPELYNLGNIKENEMNLILEDVLKKEKPVAYIVGFEFFYGYKIRVDENVLIPRTETEITVLEVIKYIKSNFEKGSEIKIADICTGSGAILIAIVNELNKEYKFKLIASDISNEALVVANDNFKTYDLDVKIYCGDLIKPLIENKVEVDIVVSNPPYIGVNNFVEDIVVATEPKLALFGGEEGYEIYFDFFEQLKIYNQQVKVFWEIGCDQKSVLKEKGSEFNVDNFKCEKDLFDRDRMISFDWR